VISAHPGASAGGTVAGSPAAAEPAPAATTAVAIASGRIERTTGEVMAEKYLTLLTRGR
jgi:hypothetical protein